jgi:hypothetical protein
MVFSGAAGWAEEQTAEALPPADVIDRTLPVAGRFESGFPSALLLEAMVSHSQELLFY